MLRQFMRKAMKFKAPAEPRAAAHPKFAQSAPPCSREAYSAKPGAYKIPCRSSARAGAV